MTSETSGSPWRHESLGPDPHARPRLELLRAYGRAAASVVPQILLNPFLPRAAIEALSLRRVRALIAHARARVPFYREHLRDVDPASLTSREALGRVPLLTKALLREHADRMLADDADRPERLLVRSSSGSSGAPVKLYFDPLREVPRRLQELRFLTANGFRPWYAQLVFDNPGHAPPKQFLLGRLGIWKRVPFPWWLDADAAVEFVRKERFEVLHGVLSGLRMFALAVRARGGLGYTPRLILSKGELLDPQTRTLIEGELGARIVDYYATEETGIIAWQCPSGAGYHLDQDLVFVETIDDAGRLVPPGEVGEIVVTNLYQRTMPFVRYRLGDLGVLAPEACPCGRGLPLLRNLLGRKIDLIVTPEGDVHHPFGLIALLEEIPEVTRFRVLQVREDALEIEVNWAAGLGPEGVRAGEARIHADLRARLGPTLAIHVKEVPTFTQSFSQKFPLVRGLPGRSFADLLQGSYRDVKF